MGSSLSVPEGRSDCSMTETRPFPPIPARTSRTWSLPNMLTYARILAVPAIVLCYYLENYIGRLGGACHLHRGERDRLSRRAFRARLAAALRPRPHARSDCRQAARRHHAPSPCLRRHDRGLVAACGHRHPHPRDRGVGPARVPRRAPRQRAGHPARQVEDDHADGRAWISPGGTGGRPYIPAGRPTPDSCFSGFRRW